MPTPESIELQLELTVDTAVEPSQNVLRIAGMFGLGIDRRHRMQIIPPTKIRLSSGQVIFVTGPSGSGKSSLLRLIDHATRARTDVSVFAFDQLAELPDRPLVDCFGELALEQVTSVLSRAGLNDAFVMLRRPRELSDGQRYRLRLAQVMSAVDTQLGSSQLILVLADEFGATLDRMTAKIIARHIRKWTRKTGVCFIAATTHDDLLESLAPDVLVEKQLGQKIDVLTR